MGVAALERKPILIHTREAWDDTLALLAEHWAPTGLGGVMHCFSGSLEQARASIEMGFFISFAGMLTFPVPRSCGQRRRRCRWSVCWWKPTRRT
jgi:TatD DNase family protein